MSTTVVDPKPVDTEVDLPPFDGDERAPEPPAKPVKGKDDLAELRKQLKDQETRIGELSASERYWADQARGRVPAGDDPGEPAEDPDPEPEPDETPDEFLDRLSKEGAGAIAKVLDKKGYVRKQDVAKVAEQVARQIVEKERGKLGADAKLIGQFPELRDEKSELFQATATIYRELIADDPGLKSSPATLFMAARAAKAELATKAKAAHRDDGEPGDYREDREETRRRRIEAQNGDTGRGRSTPYEGDHEDLGPAQREVIDLFSRFGVDERSYREQRAKDRRR